METNSVCSTPFAPIAQESRSFPLKSKIATTNMPKPNINDNASNVLITVSPPLSQAFPNHSLSYTVKEVNRYFSLHFGFSFLFIKLSSFLSFNDINTLALHKYSLNFQFNTFSDL
ncbi:hypothetical protein, partial [Bacillus sp. CGMCC 1.16541]|uniref:hypothetical protein n=1 Tax=Bacillus sp. CGMCC 1.16541 TaxID=2185143 RepID=UPI001EF6254B